MALAILFFCILHSAFCIQLLAQEPPPPAPAPANVEDEFNRAVFYGKKFADLGEYASAYEHFQKADELKRDQPAVLYNKAVVLARAGRYVDAQVAVERYQRLFTDGAEKPLIAKLELELGFQRELQKKRQADQEYADLFNRAKYAYGRGSLDEALRLFGQAEQARANDPAAAFNQAVIYEKQGNYAKAIERFRRYAELEPELEQKASIDQRVYAMQHELDEMRTRIVCSFCGHKLPIGATWCHRCWHGPYLVKSPVWSSRPCVEGASATRATYFSDARFNKNDILPCLAKDGSMLESLRYSPARQRAIQDARRAEGWTYQGEVIQNWADRQGNQIRYQQGPEYLEKVTSSVGGEILTYVAHSGGEGYWLLDREDLVVDAQRYVNRYTYDAAGRIAQQQTDYQNTAACHHLISTTADFAWQNDALATVSIKGGYQGFPAEGEPKTDWNANVVYAYDEKGRLAKEELAVASLNKTYTKKAAGALRDEISKLYTGLRVGKPLENAYQFGDRCATSGSFLIGNQIDLRPFYVFSPNLAIALQSGVTRALVSFTYPDSYRP